MRLPLPIHSYRRKVPANAARIVNMQAEQMPPEAKAPVALFGAPGIRSWVNPNLGIGRGLTSRNNQLYALCGTTYCRIAQSGEVYQIGQVTGKGRAYFANNGLQTVIVASESNRNDDNIGYVETNNTLSKITDPDFTARRIGEPDFIDDYVAFVEYGSGRWFISDILDLTVFNSLDFATSETSPDLLFSLRCVNEQVFLFGSESIERWYNSGIEGFPFERTPGAALKMGIGAPKSLVRLEQNLYFLANDMTFRAVGGSGTQRISQHGVEAAIKVMERPYDCEGFSYTHEGHRCVVWNFLHDQSTWVYDLTTGEFAERDSFPDMVWRACDSTNLNGTTYVQDRASGAVGILDSTINTEWDEMIRREWTYASASSGGKRCIHHSLETSMEVGSAPVSGTGSDPKILTEWSDDGGVSWRSGVEDSLGKFGNRRQIVVSDRLGSSYDRVYRRVVTDPVSVNVYDTFLNMTVTL